MRDGRRVDPPRTTSARLWGRGRSRARPTVRTTDAGGIDPFTSRPVSVRLPDGPVNALSELCRGTAILSELRGQRLFSLDLMEKTRETISLDSRAQHRPSVLNHDLAGALTVDEASRVLRLSTRQVRRLVDRYRHEGATALVHGNRGRPQVNRTDPTIRARASLEATMFTTSDRPRRLPSPTARGRERPVSPRGGTILLLVPYLW
jgi:winged helix-turn helix protein